VIDSAATHAYVLSRSTMGTGEMSRDVRVAEYDLATGKASHGITIFKLLQAATAPLTDSLNSGQVIVHGLPGVGLSPDNQTLAILSPSASQVTLIDTATWQQVLRPAVKAADNSDCFPESPAFYSALTFIGDRIVATGFVYDASQPLGAIDFGKSATCSFELPARDNVARGVRGSIGSLLPLGWQFRWTELYTDGTSLYAVGIKESNPDSTIYVSTGIFRLNPQTLKVEAEVEYPLTDSSNAFSDPFTLAFAPPS
jgi:hypothetical protein